MTDIQYGKIVRLDKPSPRTWIYGTIQPDGTLIEAFATNSAAGCASEGMKGTVHDTRGWHKTVITQSEFNGAFLNCMEDEMDDEDRTLSIEQLKVKYPDEGEMYGPVADPHDPNMRTG